MTSPIDLARADLLKVLDAAGIHHTGNIVLSVENFVRAIVSEGSNGAAAHEQSDAVEGAGHTDDRGPRHPLAAPDLDPGSPPRDIGWLKDGLEVSVRGDKDEVIILRNEGGLLKARVVDVPMDTPEGDGIASVAFKYDAEIDPNNWSWDRSITLWNKEAADLRKALRAANLRAERYRLDNSILKDGKKAAKRERDKAREALQSAPPPGTSDTDLVAQMDWYFQVRLKAIAELDALAGKGKTDE